MPYREDWEPDPIEHNCYRCGKDCLCERDQYDDCIGCDSCIAEAEEEALSSIEEEEDL